ncbi:LacI family DNA-binding transcriptional regulator [candidate division KSB1 bacterium]|nr:LacI family DNA-binding transcriptional regulator [candidate division KSB1 bacterium]
MKNVSINDIAGALHVSKTTVSLVLNNKGDALGISKRTQSRILKLAKKLNYQPNKIAKGLILGKTETIGVVLADISNVFYSKIARAIEDSLSHREYQVLFLSSDEDPAKEKKGIEILKHRIVDGFIISTTQLNKNIILQLQEENYPFVLIDRHFPDIHTNSVIVDNRGGALAATEHLITMGHNKIAHLTLSTHLYAIQQRIAGYRQALEAHRIAFSPDWIQDIPYTNAKKRMMIALKTLISIKGMTALFFANNRLTILALQCLQDMKINVPNDVAIASFDDVDTFKVTHPSITAVEQPLEAIGKYAVDILIEEINNSGKMNPKKQVILPTKLIIRQSSRKYPVTADS